MFCPRCGKELPEGVNFCQECGYRFQVPVCPICGTSARPGTKFCVKCGASLEDADPQPKKNTKRDKARKPKKSRKPKKLI